MIVEVTTTNISIFDNSFVSKKYILNEIEKNPFAKIYAYIIKNEVIGYLYYSDIYERAEINQIEVDKFHRNCGIGTELMKFLIKVVEKSITLEVKVDNVYAIKLYKSVGFKEKSLRKGYYQGTDGILMEKINHNIINNEIKL